MSLHDDLAFLSVAELSQRIKTKKLASLALTEAYLARIDKLAKPLNCFVTVTADLAREDAKRADAEIAAGKWRGPLHGIPYGLKDLVDTKGIRTTWGAKPFADRIPDADATVYVKLREAGAVLLGKLSMIELAGGLGYHWADAAFNGACRTPWDLDRWAGGSSSGSASAVSAGLVAFAIGSETWGSIVCPASFCGVTGLRPTFGLVSKHGAMPLVWSFDKLGPLCRTALDTSMVLAAITGKDPLDPFSVAAPRASDGVRAGAASGAKIARLSVPEDPGYARGAIDPLLDAACETFAAAGATIETITPAAAPWPVMPCGPAATAILAAEVRSVFEQFLASGKHKQLADKTHVEGRTMYDLPEPGGALYVKAQRVRRMAVEAVDALFAKYDAVLTANMAMPPPLIAKNLDDGFPSADTGGALGALAGLPAVAFPIGFVAADGSRLIPTSPQKGKLPIGATLLGKPFDEAKLISLVSGYQAKTRWHDERPPHA